MTVRPVESATEAREDNGSDEESGVFHELVPKSDGFIRGQLPSAPPDGDASEDYEEGQEELAGHTHPTELRAGHGDAAILGLFGANGD